MTIKTIPLKGYKSLTALNAFNAMLLGIKMIPQYLNITYEDFYGAFKDMPDNEREKILRQAAAFVNLEKEEVESIISFAADANGVPYGPANLKNLGPDELHEIIVAVCMEIGRIKVSLISTDEKKNCPNSQLTSEGASSDGQTRH